MQILYLLVLGDKSNVLYGKDLCFNANYRFTHEFIDGDEDKVKVSWEIKDILPDNFFTTRENNKNCCIDNVSEIIGINGSGKTLIEKEILKIATNNRDGKYIIIYKKDKKIFGCHVLGFKHVNINSNKIIYEIDIAKNCYFFISNKIDNKRQLDINKYSFESDADLVYLCNHYCFTWDIFYLVWDISYGKARVFDYSTAGLINSDNFISEITHTNIVPNAYINSHRCKEMERIIKLLVYLHEKNANSKNTKINFNNYDFSINNISINQVNILYNRDIIITAQNAISQLSKESSQFIGISATYLQMGRIIDEKNIPRYADHFILTFWCFVASRIVEHINNLEGAQYKQFIFSYKNASIINMLNEYCMLLKKITNSPKLEIKDVNTLKNQILDAIRNNESENVYNYFFNINNKLNIQIKDIHDKDNDDERYYLLEFKFSDKKSNQILFTILNLYFKIINLYPFVNFNFEPSISSGELSFLTIWARLYDYLENNPKSKHAIIFIDEAEASLHPEWQKALCQNTISFIEDYCEVKQRKLYLHIIFASHSPMLLSDVPTGNVIFLNKGNSADNLNNIDLKTFAGDIFDIYKNGFFLQNGSIGNFALSKVDSVIQHISQGNISDVDRKIIDMIGDGLITNYFHRIIDNQSSSSNDSQK